MSSITAPLLKTIEVQDKLIKNLENEVVRLKAEVKEWEEAIAKNKQKLGFLKKHKAKK